jgi:hypothetical protein
MFGNPIFRITATAFFVLHLTFSTRAEVASVMLYAGNASQSDTMGYNIVTDISSVVYKNIMNGTTRLWDSEKKGLQILPASLQKIEKSSGVTFSGCAHLFIYETWTMEKKISSSELLGFYFSGQDKSGQKVSFGFVDAKELPDVALGTYVKLNPNGTEPLTIARVLRCKMYYYNIVQYDGKKITETSQAIELKNKKLKLLMKFIECPAVKEVKKVRYSISKNDSMFNAEGAKKTIAMLDVVEDYFMDTRETLYAMAGEYAPELKKKKTINVTSVIVAETWKKENGIISSEPESIIIYVNKKPLKELSLREFLNLGIIIDFKSAYDVLKEKEFSFRIMEINGNEIPYQYANSYYSALKKYKWNALSEYVKYD